MNLNRSNKQLEILQAIQRWFDMNPNESVLKVRDLYLTDLIDYSTKEINRALFYLEKEKDYRNVFSLEDDQGHKFGDDYYEDFLQIPDSVIGELGEEIDTTDLNTISYVIKESAE